MVCSAKSRDGGESLSGEAKFLEVYRLAHNNAVNLLSEAELLFKNAKYARAYALAFTALEEISKSQLAADVYTGYIDENEFWEHIKKHDKKIRRMAWATEDARRYLDEDENYADVFRPKVARRMDALYVNFDGNVVQSPENVITHDDAKSLLHTVNVAFDRIWCAESMSIRIGTKSFMK